MAEVLQQQQQQQPQQQTVTKQAAKDQSLQTPRAQEQVRYKRSVTRHELKITAVQSFQLPEMNLLEGAYQETGLELQGKEQTRSRLLSQSRERFRLQKDYQESRKKPVSRKALAGAKTLSFSKAKKMSDAALVQGLGKYRGPAEYLKARYGLIRNRYYSLLPNDQMMKLSRDQLMFRLKKLYAEKAKDRNGDLIDYYQQLVRLKDLEAEQQKKEKKPKTPKSAGELKEEKAKNKKALDKNKEILEKSHLSVTEKEMRREAMRKVLAPKKKEEFLKPSKLTLSDAQKEGIRDILAWMYRNCNKSSSSKEPFVYRLTQAPPEKLLMMFYLIETGKQDSASPEDFYPAVTDYEPDVNAFKDRVVASKAKFWKRIGKDSSDDVIDWSLIGQVNRIVLKDNTPVEFAERTEQVKQADTALAAAMGEGLIQQRDALMDVLVKKGNLLLTLYRSAGLSPDMPPVMIRDQGMRAQAVSLLKEVNEHIKKLTDVSGQLTPEQRAGKLKYDKKASDKDSGEEGSEESESEESEQIEQLDTAATVIGTGLNVDDAIQIGGTYVESLTGATAYTTLTGGLTGIVGALGVIVAFQGAFQLASGSSLLTTADHTSQALSITGDLLSSLGDGLQGFTDLIGNFVNLGEAAEETAETAGWLGETSVRTVGESFSTISGGIQFVAGALTTVAGVVTTIAGAIDAGRAYSSQKDLQRSESSLSAIKEEDLTEEQKELRGFLSHQKREVGLQKESAAVKTASGILLTAGGILTMTGILAPLGGLFALVGGVLDVGIGTIYAGKKKNENRRQTVDEYLKLDKAVSEVQRSHPDPSVAGMEEKELRKLLRQEALAELGYATYKECYADIAAKNAELLYKKVFEDPQDAPDREMYLDALKSLGIKIRQEAGKPPIPTREMILAKMME